MIEYDPDEIVNAIEDSSIDIMKKDAFSIVTAVTFGTPDYYQH